MNLNLDQRVDKLLITYQNKKTFTGCGVALSTFRSRSFTRRTWYRGHLDDAATSLVVKKETFFDLASLTKPLVTVLCLLCLVKEKLVRWEDRLDHLFPIPVPDDKKNIRLIDLVCHTSSLPAHRSYFRKRDSVSGKIEKSKLISLILHEKLEDIPRRSYLYSDLDYLLLGCIVEYRSGMDLATFWREKIVTPLRIGDHFQAMGEKGKRFATTSFAVTGKCPWTGSSLAGLVHDDNCRALGRLSGHAGLFGTLPGVLTLCESILLSYMGVQDHPSFERADLYFLVKERKRPQWACGFDVPTGRNSSCGHFFSRKTIGHLGFTGTSFWIDLVARKMVVLLTNRVIYGNDNSTIKELRPELHDALLAP